MADWNRIQGIATATSGVTSWNVSFTSPVGNPAVVVGAVLLDTGKTLTSVTDDKGNSYTVFNSHDDGILYTASFRSTGLLTNGPQTLTFTPSAATSNEWSVQDEFSPPTGASSISTDGATSQFNATGTSFVPFTTSLSDDLVYAVAMSDGSSTHGASFNAGTGDGTARNSEWGIQSAPGSVTMNLAAQATHFWGPAFAVNAQVSASTITLMAAQLL